MDCISSYSKISQPQFPPHQLKNTLLSTPSSILFSPFNVQSKTSLAVVASNTTNNNNSSGGCEYSGLTAPLVPSTEAGRSLRGALQSGRDGVFHAVVEKELVKLSYMRDDAFLRMNLNLCSDEALLHSIVEPSSTGTSSMDALS